MQRIFSSLFYCFLSLTVFAQESADPIPALPALTDFPNVRDFAMSFAGDEVYVSVQSPFSEISVIVRIKKENDKILIITATQGG